MHLYAKSYCYIKFIVSILFDSLQALNKPTLLWTNPNPTSDFGAQNVNISNIDDYTSFCIISKQYKTNTYGFTQHHLLNLKDVNFAIQGVSNDGRVVGISRRVDIHDTYFSFSDADLSTTSTATINNSQMIPLYIYGIK